MTTTTDHNDEALAKWIELRQSGATLGDLSGMEPEHYEILYAQAYRLYSAARYADAQQVFSFLTIRSPYDTRFTMGLGACFQAQGEWEQALRMYACVVPLDIENPVPPFHLCECLVALGQTTEAMDVLAGLLERITKPEHAELKQRSEALLALLKLQQENTPS